MKHMTHSVTMEHGHLIKNLIESIRTIEDDAFRWKMEAVNATVDQDELIEERNNLLVKQKLLEMRLNEAEQISVDYSIELVDAEQLVKKQGVLLDNARRTIEELDEKHKKELQAARTLLERSATLRQEFDRIQHLYSQEKDRSTHQTAVIARLSARLNALMPRKKRDTCPDWLRALLLQLAHHCCMRCGATEDLQIDRFYPGNYGGQYVLMNTGVLCKPCNQDKSDHLGRAWHYWLRNEHIPFLTKCEALYLKQKKQMSFLFDAHNNDQAHGIG